MAFPELASEFRQQAKEADVAIFIGSSLRDHHMRDVCVMCAKSKLTYVVTRSGNFEDGLVPDGAVIVRESTGRFLVSTLPTFLRNQDETILKRAAENIDADRSKVLAWLVTATDESSDTKARCAAIEDLANAKISLGQEDLMILLRSSNADVSIFGLGLIPISIDREMILEEVKKISEEKQDPNFTAELDMLSKIMGETKLLNPD